MCLLASVVLLLFDRSRLARELEFQRRYFEHELRRWRSRRVRRRKLPPPLPRFHDLPKAEPDDWSDSALHTELDLHERRTVAITVPQRPPKKKR